MSDILTQAKLRDREALERCEALRQYFAARKGVKASHAPTVAQGEPLEQPSKPEKRGGHLTTVGRLARMFSIRIKHDEQERDNVWRSLYPETRNPYR